MTDRILRFSAVSARTGLGRTTIYALIKRGEFPAQVQLTTHAVGWRESAIDAWIAARAAGVSTGVSTASDAA